MRFPFEIREIRAATLEELNKEIRRVFCTSQELISIQVNKNGYIALYLEYNYEHNKKSTP